MLEPTARRLLAATARAQADGRLPSLVAAVVQDGALTWSARRGDPGTGGPGTGDDPTDVQYRIGSITKTFTAVLVMRLRDEGLLSLDTPVRELVRDAPGGDRTVGQLLGHAAGLRAETDGEWWERTAGRTWTELVEPLGAGAVLHPAGRRFHYSNLGYGILGRLVETVRGQDWATCLDHEVLTPLGMTRTTSDAVAPAAPGLAVHPFSPAVVPEPAHDYRAMAAAGQLWSTVADLARWGRFLLGDTAAVLAPGTVAEMARPGLVDSPADGDSYGLGLQVRHTGGRQLIGHGGSVPGFLAVLLVDPAERTAAVALANATAGLDGQLVPRLLDIVRAAEPAIARPWRPLSAPDLVPLDLLGTWFWGPSPLLVTQTADGPLELRGLVGAGRGSRFRRTGTDTFEGLDDYYAGEVLQVVRDESGAPGHLDIGSFVLTREPYAPGPTPGGAPSPGWGA